MTVPGILREARALVFVLVCLSLSAALHTWAHGDLPPRLALLAGAGLVTIVAIPLTGRASRSSRAPRPGSTACSRWSRPVPRTPW